MITYRFIGIRADGERTQGRNFRCQADASALALAYSMLKGFENIEVWLDLKQIGTVSNPDSD